MWDDAAAEGRVSAGLYIGGTGQPRRRRIAEHLVDKREVLRNGRRPTSCSPTTRCSTSCCSARRTGRCGSTTGSETLRYLVLDELHTYDGAQGADVACLIRRLRARLGIRPGALTFVGTSATLGNQEGARERLAEFASLLAGEPVGETAILGESRYTAAESLDAEVDLAATPARRRPRTPRPRALRPTPPCGAQRRRLLWLGETVGDSRSSSGRGSAATPSCAACSARSTAGCCPWAELSDAIARVEPSFAELDDDTRWLLWSELPRARSARPRVDDGGTHRPFLALRVQLWVRELRRLMRGRCGPTPPGARHERYAFAWHDVLAETTARTPGSRWRAAGTAGSRGLGHAFWPEGSEVVSANAAEVGRAWLGRRPAFGAASSCRGRRPTRWCTDEFLCPKVSAGRRDGGGVLPAAPRRFAVRGTREDVTQKAPRRWRDALPELSRRRARSPSSARGRRALGSVLVTHLFASPYNGRPEAPGLHRLGAGRLAPRGVLRRPHLALQGANGPAGAPATRAATRPRWTPSPRACSRAQWRSAPTLRARIARWLPTDLVDLPEALRHRDRPDDGARQEALWARIAMRLSWEVAQEYGLGARSLGRTLERTGCSTARARRRRRSPAPGRAGAGRADIRAQKLLGPRSEEVDERRRAPPPRRHCSTGCACGAGCFIRCSTGTWRTEANRFLLSKRRQPLLSPFARGVRPPSFLQGVVHSRGLRELRAGAATPSSRGTATSRSGCSACRSAHDRRARGCSGRRWRASSSAGVLEERLADKAAVWGFSVAVRCA
jgi:DEAD/DEAH box helicase domain-containing protein